MQMSIYRVNLRSNMVHFIENRKKNMKNDNVNVLPGITVQEQS